MPILITILMAIGGAIWWWARRNPRDALDLAQDTVTTVKNAPRRFAFRRQTNVNPVEGLDDEASIIATIGQAFIEMDDLPTVEQKERLITLIAARFQCGKKEATEMLVYGHWVISQCPSPAQAVPRLGRRLYKVCGPDSWKHLQDVLMGIVGDDLSQKQITAIDDLRIAFKR